MSKFKIKMKMTGLELEIEGTKDDIPIISQNLAAQFGGMLSPAANIIQGTRPAIPRGVVEHPAAETEQVKGRKRSSKRTSALGGDSKSPKHFDWTHDVQQWGTPLQDWNPLQKSIWLLYVAKAQGAADEMSPGQISNTFNKHFRQAGLIRPSNVSRDLGKAKTTAPAKVNEDSTKSPATWFLTSEGEKAAVELVSAGRGLKGT
jgi:hypothetical protein